MTAYTDAALDFAIKAAKEDKGVAYFSLDDSKHQLCNRILGKASGVPFERIEKVDINQKEFEKLQKLANSPNFDDPLWFYDAPNLTLDQFSERVRKRAQEQDLKLVIVDSVELLQKVEGHEMVEYIMAFDDLEKELGIKVLGSEEIEPHDSFEEGIRKGLEEVKSGQVEPYEFIS
jgi:replicative DNA helicase